MILLNGRNFKHILTLVEMVRETRFFVVFFVSRVTNDGM